MTLQINCSQHSFNLYLIERARNFSIWISYIHQHVKTFEKCDFVHVFKTLQLNRELLEPTFSYPLLQKIHLLFEQFSIDDRHDLFDAFFMTHYQDAVLYSRMVTREIFINFNADQLLRSIQLFGTKDLHPNQLTCYLFHLTRLDGEIGDYHFFNSLKSLFKQPTLIYKIPDDTFNPFIEKVNERLEFVSEDAVPAECTLEILETLNMTYNHELITQKIIVLKKKASEIRGTA